MLISGTEQFAIGFGNQRTALAGLVARVNAGSGNGVDVTVEVLINGVVAASVVVDSATVNQVDTLLSPMVLIPADARVSVRTVPVADIVDGNLFLSVQLLGY